MRRVFTYLFALVLCVYSVQTKAQSQSKFDFPLTCHLVGFEKGHEEGTTMLPVFIKGNMAQIKKMVEACKGTFKYSYGNIAAVVIPLSSLRTFYSSHDVIRVEGRVPHMRALNDTMRVRNHMVEVQMGQTPLTQGYKGKGVVIGFIDTGLDILHPDFQDSTGKTRVQFLWDQNRPKNKYTPAPYGYGQAWSKKQIDSALTVKDTPLIETMDSCSTILYGHGCSVAGIGSGNGRANGLEMGSCPESDIIMVAYNFYSANPNLMTDAVNFIYTKADQLGEPCVINASLGDYNGSHDGTDLQAQIIDSMITSQRGRAFVAAAGNAGNIPYHLGYTVIPADTNFTWFGYSGGYVDFQVFADTANFSKVQFAIGADKTNPDYVFRAKTKFSSILPYINTSLTDTLKNSAGQRLGIINYFGQLTGGTYSIEFYIVPDSVSYYWRFITTGTGKFDSWDYANIIDTSLPSAAMFPDIKNYKRPDTAQTICSSFQCSPHVTTVANYWNRSAYIDYDTALYSIPGYNACKLSPTSSFGPTRDGRIKPEISAAGNGVMSCLPTQFQAYYISHVPQATDIGGWHFLDGGTSSASPEVAGAEAMLLQRYPLATNDQIKNMILYCADQDSCTGHSLPDNAWGYGKLDAFKSMTGCALDANTITTLPNSTLSIYPNPTNNTAQITYDFTSVSEYCVANITIIDVMGKQLKSIELKNNKGIITFNKDNLSNGIYFYSLVVDGKRLKTEKLIIL